MNRSTLASALLLASSLAALPASAQVTAAPKPQPQDLQIETRLEVARLLLAQSGIKAALSSDAAALRALAAAFSQWDAANHGPAPATADSCLVEADPADSQPAQLMIQDLLPDFSQRFGRALSFSFELKDLQDVFLVEGPNEDTPDPDDKSIQTVVNTESYTPTFSFTFRPGDLLLSSADLALALSITGENSSQFDLSAAGGLQGRTFSHFARSLRGGRRFLNALTLSGSVTRRPEFDGQDRVPPEFLRQDRTAMTWGFKFDPFLYFNPLAAKGSSFEAAVGSGKLFGTNGLGPLDDPCDSFQIAKANPNAPISRLCLIALSQIPPRAAAWLPTFEFKSEDQFDFVRTGNQFLPAPEGNLETYKFTWDFARMFEVAKARKTALAIFKAHRDLTTPPQIKNTKEITFRKGVFVHHRLEAKEGSGFDKLTWRIETPQGKKRICAFPGVQLTSDGLLIGLPEQDGEFGVPVVLSDALKRESKQQFKVTIEKTGEADIKQALMAKYLELAVRPEVIADDRWFDSLLRSWEALNGGIAPALPVTAAASLESPRSGS